MNSIKRREFLRVGAGCCLVLTGAGSFVYASDDKPDPKKLNYCGYKCPDDCKMYLAGKSDNEELKKEAFKMWRLEEKYGLTYAPELAYCEKCKTEGEVKSPLLTGCAVRKCAIGKGYDCCIECDELKACDKEIWTTFPQFKQEVIKMQEAYKA